MTSKEHGDWFLQAAFCVVPLIGKAIQELQRGRQNLDSLKLREEEYLESTEKEVDRQSAAVGTKEGQDAWTLTESLRKDLRAAIAFQRAFYRSQPKWNLVEVPARSRADASAIVAEFLEMAEEASAEYGWMLNEPPDHADWELHAWKHVCYKDLLEVSSEAKRSWVPEIRIDAAVGSKNVEGER